ncbi:hypothetical protein [Pseudomonas sp. BF-R-30]|uniref:hypothetical protein n=1 Tax=Pseudomonas sp. BF-R-30 TaxID=2832384 RepID=UPI001CBDF4C0|nr:hypothetical protein [Pseudomonas sp. BF-R-30]
MALTITFNKLATNRFGAVTGDLKLLDGATVVRSATAFSGGGGNNPLDDGQYRLRLDIRGDESTNQATIDGALKPFYGIQKVGTNVASSDGIRRDMQVEWGTIRARLNPVGGAPDHGDYIHGKHRLDDWTHGCICDRSEVLLAYLWDLQNPPVGIDVTVSGGTTFNLEEIVTKNVGNIVADKKVAPD